MVAPVHMTAAMTITAGPSKSSGTVSFRSDPICNANTGTVHQYNCDANWAVEYRIYWEWANAPSITTQPTPNDRNLCIGATTTISVVGDASARYYQWQVNTNTGVPTAGCATTGWVNVSTGTGGTTANYTPPQTAGARQYRCLVTSNCSADFSSKTTASNCVRVNYFPYAPPIISDVCGVNASINSTHTFTATLPPAAGAIGNATYTWSISPTTGTTLSTTTGSSTDITFASAGTFTVTLTPANTAGCGNTTSTCIVAVSAPDCNFIYCDPSTSNTTVGSTNSPVTLTAALALTSSTRNIIRMASGTYTQTTIVSIPTGVTIEGGYVNTGSIWTKSSAAVTTINFTNASTGSSGTNIAHVAGFIGSANNWTLQDLTITTANASGTSTSGNGMSNYGIYINGATGYTITRCSITSGNASGGNAGTNGNAGGAGASGAGGGGATSGSCENGAAAAAAVVLAVLQGLMGMELLQPHEEEAVEVEERAAAHAAEVITTVAAVIMVVQVAVAVAQLATLVAVPVPVVVEMAIVTQVAAVAAVE